MIEAKLAVLGIAASAPSADAGDSARDVERPAGAVRAAEVGLLQQDRQREAEERRWAQARRVYITLDVFPGNKAHPGNENVAGRSARPPAITATVHNTR